jgi:DNA modification methylase
LKVLFKKYDQNSGKVLKNVRPLLVSPAKGYIRPPNTGSEWWLTTTSIWNVDELIGRRIRDWRRLTGETGHTGGRSETFRKDHNSIYTGTHSVFPVPLAEWIILRYGGEPGGLIIDAFAGGPPRALAASAMGYRYLGFEIRSEQIDENVKALSALGFYDNVSYKCGDGCLLDGVPSSSCDFALTCPPYFNLEKYSDLAEDISYLPSYEEFNQLMFTCAQSHKRVMKPGAFVCIVTCAFRDKETGELIDFPGDTIRNFQEAGLLFWQDVVLSRNFASAAVRASNAWKGFKLVNRHERLIVMRTPEVKGETEGKKSKIKN